MFFFGDESGQGSVRVIGILTATTEQLFEFEKRVLEYRIRNRMWSEVDWKSIPSSIETAKCYVDFIDLFFQQPGICFTSLLIKGKKLTGSAPFARCFYSMIRSVSEMININDSVQYDGKLYVVFDRHHELNNNWQSIKEFLSKDRRVYPRFEVVHCGPSNSAIIAAIQLADLLAGAVAYKNDTITKENSKRNEIKKMLLNKIENELGFGLDADLPRSSYGQFKINPWHLKSDY